MADALSKGDIEKAFRTMRLKAVPERIPWSLVQWLDNPVVTGGLGISILEDLRGMWRSEFLAPPKIRVYLRIRMNC